MPPGDLTMTQTLRRVAVIGGVRIPFCRSNTLYADLSNLDMMSAVLNGLVERYNLQGVHVDESRRRWLARLVQAARSLGATIVAEGVEQRAEVDVVEHLAIEWCQGFYFAEPNLVA